MTRRILFAVVFVASMIFCAGCASMLRIDGPYEGKVIDAETKQPVEGAVVHGTWSKVHLGGAHEYYDSYEVLTDKNGEFKIPGKGFLVLSDIEDMSLIIFKAGYKQWTPNSWGGLKIGKWRNDEVVWSGNKGTFKLYKVAIEERKQMGGPTLPMVPSNSKMKLLIQESNKEMKEMGFPDTTIMPTE